MHIEYEVQRLIESRLNLCEELYNIKILSWFLRGSIPIGIYRKNSDLDVVFLFENMGEKKCAGIHDIVGWGIDFWGWDINDALDDLRKNMDYCSNNSRAKLMYCSGNHKRGALDCLHGLYLKLGSKFAGGDAEFNQKFDVRLAEMMIPNLLQEYALLGVRNTVKRILDVGKVSSNEYLYAVWRILLVHHIETGGLPGDSRIDDLLESYDNVELSKHILALRGIYKESMTKSSQCFEIDFLNEYLVEEYKFIDNKLNNGIDKMVIDIDGIISKTKRWWK